MSEDAFSKAEKFLESVKNEYAKGTVVGFGYASASESFNQNLSAVGLLCREYMGWGPRTPQLGKGVKGLTDAVEGNIAGYNMYFIYYATQVVHFYTDGPAWKKWNERVRDFLISKQKKDGADKGSFEKDGGGLFGAQIGKVGTTCMCLLTLEVYYRHLPLYKRDGAGMAELER